MKNEVNIRYANTGDINTIGFLAHQVWPATYGDTIEPARLQYMLQLIYHPAALRDQMLKQHHIFLIAEINKDPLGFASFSKTAEKDIYKLHKLYVRTDVQGMGLGKALIDAVINHIQPLAATSLLLNVYRYNKAKAFYEKLGFSVIKEEDIDIGNGHFMYDYVMAREL